MNALASSYAAATTRKQPGVYWIILIWRRSAAQPDARKPYGNFRSKKWWNRHSPRTMRFFDDRNFSRLPSRSADRQFSKCLRVSPAPRSLRDEAGALLLPFLRRDDRLV